MIALTITQIIYFHEVGLFIRYNEVRLQQSLATNFKNKFCLKTAHFVLLIIYIYHKIILIIPQPHKTKQKKKKVCNQTGIPTYWASTYAFHLPFHHSQMCALLMAPATHWLWIMDTKMSTFHIPLQLDHLPDVTETSGQNGRSIRSQIYLCGISSS